MLNCLLLDEDESNKTREQKFLGKIKHVLAAADDPHILETLLESTAEIMISVDINSQLFLFSLILLVDQLDNPHFTVRLTALKLIRKSCHFHLKGGFELILSKVIHVRNELFDYLSVRLANRPQMVREFAEAVLGVEIAELVKKMVPVVLPKLAVTQQDNDHAVVTLHELACLTRASFRCQAYARSLLYFESYVRVKSGSFNPAAEKSGIFEDEDVSFLMEIYGSLDEPDGLSGLACLRNSKSLQDQFLINKKAGNWAEVLTSCEKALQMEPTLVQRHSDVLNCLLNMCHLQAMVTHVEGLISRVPQYKKTWCMQGIQAEWRLGRWNLMDEYLNGADEEGLLCSSSESNAFYDMDVAKILQAMMKKDQFLVAERIALSKQALIAPLAAAGMDSYIRAYPFVVKLHVLRELEDFHNLLVGESFLEKSFHLDEPGFKKGVENWESRLIFTHHLSGQESHS